MTKYLETEQDKQMKLSTIATEKYNIDLQSVDLYLPTNSKEFQAKVKRLENTRIKEAKEQRKEIRQVVRSKNVVMEV